MDRGTSRLCCPLSLSGLRTSYILIPDKKTKKEVHNNCTSSFVESFKRENRHFPIGCSLWNKVFLQQPALIPLL